MKTIIVALLVVFALSAPFTFEKDSHEESPISVITKGFFDPSVSGEAKISAFLKLANELIPLAEVKAPAQEPVGNRLRYGYTWCSGQLGDMFNFCFNANAYILIGWNFGQGSVNSTNNQGGAYNVSFTPYVQVYGGLNVTLSSYPALVGYGIYLQIVNTQLPTSLTIGQNAICYSSLFSFQPGAVYTQIGTALLQCMWYVTPYQSGICSTVTGPIFQQFFWPLWSGYYMTLIQPGCIYFG
jgi:hypothetical protein